MIQKRLLILICLTAILYTISAEDEKKTKQKRGAQDRQDILYGGWRPILPGHRYYFGPRYPSTDLYQAQRPYIINPTNQVVHVHEDAHQYQESSEGIKDYGQEPGIDQKSVQSILNLQLPAYNGENVTPYPGDSKDKNIFTYYPPPTTASPFTHQKPKTIKPVYSETSNKPFGLDFLDHYQKLGVFQVDSNTPYSHPSSVELTQPIPAPYKEKPSHSEESQQFAVEAIPIRVPTNLIAPANIDQQLKQITLENNIRLIKVPIIPIRHNNLLRPLDAKQTENREIMPLFGFPRQNKKIHNEKDKTISDFGKPLFFPHQAEETRPSSEQEELALTHFPFTSETENGKFGSSFDKTEPITQNSNLNVAEFHPEFPKSNRHPKNSEGILKGESSIEQLGYSPPARIEEYELPNGMKEIHTYHFPAPNYKSNKDRPLISKEHSPQATQEIRSHSLLPEHSRGPHDIRYFHIQTEIQEQPPFKLTNEQIDQNKYESNQEKHHQPIIPQFTKETIDVTNKQQINNEYGSSEISFPTGFDGINSNYGSGSYLSGSPKDSQQYNFALQAMHKPSSHDEKLESAQHITFPLNEGIPGNHQFNQQTSFEYPVYQSETETNAHKYEGIRNQDNKHQPFIVDMNYNPNVQLSSENNPHQQNQDMASALSGNNFQPSIYQIPGYEDPKEYTIEIIADGGNKQEPHPQHLDGKDRKPFDYSTNNNNNNNKGKPQNIVPVIVAEITRRPQKPAEKNRGYGKQVSEESQQSYGSFNHNKVYNIQEQNNYSQRDPSVTNDVPPRVIFPSSYQENNHNPSSDNYNSHTGLPGGRYEGPNNFEKNIGDYTPSLNSGVEKDKKSYESSNPQADEYRPEFVNQFPTNQNQQPEFPTNQQSGFPTNQHTQFSINQQPEFLTNQQPQFPVNQQQEFPTNQQSGSLANQQQTFSTNQQSGFSASQQEFSANQQSSFPSNQQDFSANQQSSFPSNQQDFSANQQSSFPSNQQDFSANQQSSFPSNQQDFSANQQSSFPSNQQDFSANQQSSFPNNEQQFSTNQQSSFPNNEQQFSANQQSVFQNNRQHNYDHDRDYQSSVNYGRPQEQTSESDYQDIQKQPTLYHIPVVIQPVYPVTTLDSQIETNKESLKEKDEPKSTHNHHQSNYRQHSTEPTIKKQETKKPKKPTYGSTQRPLQYTKTPSQSHRYETLLPHSAGNHGDQLFVSGSKNSHRPSPPKSTEMKVLASHPTKPPLSKQILSQLGLDKNTKSNLYHAYYAPADHEPPPGYVRLSLKEFKELFKNAEIHYVSSESQQSSLVLNNTTQKTEKIHYPSRSTIGHKKNQSNADEEQEEIITIDLKPGQTVNQALAELGTLDIGGVKLDATKLQNGEYGPVEIVEIIEEKEVPVNKTTLLSSFKTVGPRARERPKITHTNRKSFRNNRLQPARSLSSQATSTREVVVPVPTTMKTPAKQVPSPSPPLKSTNAAIPKRPSSKLPGRFHLTTSKYQITTRTTPRTTTTPPTDSSSTSPQFGHRIRPVRVKG